MLKVLVGTALLGVLGCGGSENAPTTGLDASAADASMRHASPITPAATAALMARMAR